MLFKSKGTLIAKLLIHLLLVLSLLYDLKCVNSVKNRNNTTKLSCKARNQSFKSGFIDFHPLYKHDLNLHQVSTHGRPRRKDISDEEDEFTGSIDAESSNSPQDSIIPTDETGDCTDREDAMELEKQGIDTSNENDSSDYHQSSPKLRYRTPSDISVGHIFEYKKRSPVVVEKGKLTMEDFIKMRMLPSAPSREYTQKIRELKPEKRLGLTEKIKREKLKIAEDTKYFDEYYSNYVEKNSLDKYSDVFPKAVHSKAKYNYDINELLEMWETRGTYFYMNTSKSVAVLDILKRIAHSSKIKNDVIQRISEHKCFSRIVSSIQKHIDIISKIKVSRHLANDPKILNSIPKFTCDEISTVFKCLAYFKFNKDYVIKSLLDYIDIRSVLFSATDLESIGLSCISLNCNFNIRQCIQKIKSSLGLTVDKDKEFKKFSTVLQGNDVRIHKINGTDVKNVKSTKTTETYPDYSVPKKQPEEGALDISRIISISRLCSKFDYMDNELFTYLADRIKQSCNDNLNAYQAAQLLDNFVLLHHLDEDFYNRIYTILLNNKERLKTGIDLIKLIHDMSMCHVPPNNKLVDYITSLILNDIESYSLVQLSSTLRNLAILGFYNDELFRKVFETPIFVQPPTVDVMDHIRIGLNSNVNSRNSYSAYISYQPVCILDKVFSNIHMAYTGYSNEFKNNRTFQFSDETVNNFKDIYLRNKKLWSLNSSALHLEISKLIEDLLSIKCELEYTTESGHIVDIAILPESLSGVTSNVNFIKGKKCAIEVHGPFHYLQKSTTIFPPPLSNKTLFKERILRLNGWDVSHLNYWDYVPWMSVHKKREVILKLIPDWVRNVCKVA